MNETHLDPLRKQILELPIVPPPTPWSKVFTFSVGGLRSVGFDRNSDLLLIVSSSGRGVIDCISGQKVARDSEIYNEGEEFLEAEGIGDLKGKTIRMSGLFGGGFPIFTTDGWAIEIVTIDWQENEILLVEPMSDLYGSLYGKPSVFYKIGREQVLRACGFSYSGQSLIIATSSEITVFERDKINVENS